MSAMERSVSRAAPRTMPERLTGRNSGPLVIPAAAIHALTAATGFRCRPCGMAISCPRPSWSVLLLRIGDAQARGIVGPVLDVERRQLGAAECAGEAERQDRRGRGSRSGGRRVQSMAARTRRWPALSGVGQRRWSGARPGRARLHVATRHAPSFGCDLWALIVARSRPRSLSSSSAAEGQRAEAVRSQPGLPTPAAMA